MALRAVLDALGMTPSKEYADTTTDTETSDEFVDSLEQQEETMAKRRIKYKAPAEVPNDNFDDVAIATPDSSPQLSSETRTPAVQLDNDEDGRNMAKGNRKSQAIPEVLKDDAESIDIAASPVVSPKESSELLAPASPPNNGEDDRDMRTINMKSKATPDAPKDSAEDVTIAASPVLPPKDSSELLAAASSLENNGDSRDMPIVNMSHPNDSPGGLHDSTSTKLPASSPKLTLESSVVTVESRDHKGDRDKAKVTLKSDTLSEASAVDLDDNTITTSLPASSLKSALESSEVTAGARDDEEGHDKAKCNKKAKAILNKPVLPSKPSKIIVASKETGTIVGAAQFGKTTGVKPGDGVLSQRVLHETSNEDRTEPAKKNKPKPGNKKKKAATPLMTSSRSDSTVKGPAHPSIAATTNSSILALASLTVSNPTNTSVSSSGPARFTIPAPSNVVALASTPRKIQLVLKNPFGFDQHREELKCRKSECGKLTNCYDGSTVICPRCGVTSYLRYCSLEHLLDKDMMFHWADECGTCTIPTESLPLVDKSTLVVRPAAMRPYISCDLRDNPARHRQAVYHSSNGAAGDYFVFNDASLRPTGPLAIGAGDIIAVVCITPDYGLYQGHSIFHELLEDCLRRGFTRPDKCLALADIITKELVTSGQWCQEVVDCLVFQMTNEFAYQIPQEMLYRFQPVA